MYKGCAVPLCNNTSIKTPSKLFVYVPDKITMRNKWLTLAQRDPATISPNSKLYFCEDHFDLENDMENYIQYRVMGSVTKVRMKPKDSNADQIVENEHQTLYTTIHDQETKKMLIEECEKELEQQSLVIKHLEPSRFHEKTFLSFSFQNK